MQTITATDHANRAYRAHVDKLPMFAKPGEAQDKAIKRFMSGRRREWSYVEKRNYPAYRPGMSTAEYVRGFESLNGGNGQKTAGFWQALNTEPATLYAGESFDFAPIVEDCDEDEPMPVAEYVRPDADCLFHPDAATLARLPVEGKQVATIEDAWHALEHARLFIAHDMDEHPMEVFHVSALNGYTVDQMIQLPRGEAPTPVKPRRTRRAKPAPAPVADPVDQAAAPAPAAEPIECTPAPAVGEKAEDLPALHILTQANALATAHAASVDSLPPDRRAAALRSMAERIDGSARDMIVVPGLAATYRSAADMLRDLADTLPLPVVEMRNEAPAADDPAPDVASALTLAAEQLRDMASNAPGARPAALPILARRWAHGGIRRQRRPLPPGWRGADALRRPHARCSMAQAPPPAWGKCAPTANCNERRTA